MLTTNQKELDLGHVKFGQPYNFKFTLKNSSKQEVHITKLVVGCQSCTTAYTNKPNVAPGETTDINVTFTPGSTGPNIKNISVNYTTGGHPSPSESLKFRAIVDG